MRLNLCSRSLPQRPPPCLIAADLDLEAFPPLSRQEGQVSRRARAEAYLASAELLKEKYTVRLKIL